MQKLFRRGNAGGWLAVELDANRVSLAHVVPNGARPVVEFAEERAWDPAEPKSLERVAREFGVKRFQCTTLLKPQEYQILLVEAPAVKPDELKAAVRWRIKDMLDYHVDDATIDVLDVPVPAGAAQRTHHMYTVAARNDIIRATIERFTAAGMPLAVIDIPDTAQRNVAARLEADQRAVVALTFDAYGGLITVNFASELYLSRRLDITAAQLAEAGGEAGARLLDRVLVETQRSLDHCERTYPFFTLGRVVIGPFSGAAALREHLAANLYLPVEALELSQVVRLPADAAAWTPAQQAKWLKLLGAGLRVERKAL
ncbi:MAG: agglutinin biogenesis protein MshI [Burkholderiales bacterium]